MIDLLPPGSLVRGDVPTKSPFDDGCQGLAALVRRRHRSVVDGIGDAEVSQSGLSGRWSRHAVSVGTETRLDQSQISCVRLCPVPKCRYINGKGAAEMYQVSTPAETVAAGDVVDLSNGSRIRVDRVFAAKPGRVEVFGSFVDARGRKFSGSARRGNFTGWLTLGVAA